MKHRLAALALALASLAAPALRAQFNFHINLNTAALSGAANAPFFLDFQLNQGSGLLSNAVTLTNFTFTGGSATGSPSLFGNAIGSLGTSVTLTDTSASPFNEFFQGFSAGTTNIQFNVSVSQLAGGAIPDEFTTAILDSELGNPQIGTNAPDTVSLVTLNLGAANTIANVSTYASTAPAGVTASAAPITGLVAVPEPSSYAFAGTAMLAGIAALRRRKSSFVRVS